ncbi:MAG: helix-turn-helix transcriptional regulator [Lachnospiraceae bacterium]|nr:helix-turn-helix transcriptional regulator [Lachnospiraceae bacterium]
MNSYPMINMKETGKRIKDLRKENKLKVDDIVEYMGFESQQAVYKWQRGESLPTVDNLYALSRLFGTTMDEILVGSEEETSSSDEIGVYDFCGYYVA